MVRLDNSQTTNKRQKKMSPTSPPSSAVVVHQFLQEPTLLQHPLTATVIGTVAGFHYRSWKSLASTAYNAVTAESPPTDNPQHERIDNIPQEEQRPPPEDQHPQSSLQLAALLACDSSEEMEADDHINSATRKAEVSDGRFNRKMKKKKDQGRERSG